MIKNIFRYILVIATVAAFASCSVDEIDNVGSKGVVKFVVQPTNYIGCDVSAGSTKALTETQLTELETKIHTAYFLAFDSNDNLIKGVSKELTLENGNIPSQVLSTDLAEDFTITACFIANVPKSYIEGIEKYSDLNELEIEYAPYSDAGYVGVPYLKLGSTNTKTHCIPMFGEITCSLENSGGVTLAIPLKRVFSKVNVNLKMNLDQSTLSSIISGIQSLLGTAADIRYELLNYTISNVPKKVKLIESDVESSWVSTSSDFEDPLVVTFSTPYRIGNSETGISFSFYVPEYILLPKTTTNTDQKNKTPNLLDAGKLPLHLTFDGYFKDGANVSKLQYNVYLGEDATNSFSIKRNTIYNNNLTIVNTEHMSNGLDNRVEVKPLNMIELYGQAANCYIISQPGTYEIDAYKGVVKSPSGTPDFSGKPYLVWNDGKNTVNLVNETNSDSKVIFTVNSNGNDIANGNAVIAIRDASDKILWSWHLWFSKADDRPDVESKLERYINDNGAFNNFRVMNRPLGATTSSGIDLTTFGGSNYGVWADGLYYQWGRKDPLGYSNGYNIAQLPTVSSNDYTTAKQNPTSLCKGWTGTVTGAGWSTTKSTNDPCPPGYKVPENSVWRSKNEDEDYSLLTVRATTTDRYAYNISTSTGNNSPSNFIFYGYGGNYNTEGKKTTQVSGTVTDTTDVEYNVQLNMPTAGGSAVFGGIIKPKEYREIEFSFSVSVNNGMFWANDKYSLSYGYSAVSSNNSGILSSLLGGAYTIVSCQYREGTALTTGSGFRKTYTGEVSWGGWQTKSDANWTDKLKLDDAIGKYLEEKGIETHAYVYDRSQNVTPANCLQVRCVKE